MRVGPLKAGPTIVREADRGGFPGAAAVGEIHGGVAHDALYPLGLNPGVSWRGKEEEGRGRRRRKREGDE